MSGSTTDHNYLGRVGRVVGNIWCIGALLANQVHVPQGMQTL